MRLAVFPVVVILSALAVLAPRPAGAIPYFAHEYGFTCQKCHTVIPHLTPFGQAYMDHGYSLPGANPDHSVFPISAKTNLLYTSDPDPGFPHAVVDELELYLAGKLSSRTNYFVEQYIVDGGEPGNLREAWFANRFTPDNAAIPIYAQGGAFTLPLPVDPETFRETYQDYAPFVQTVGNNPFDFFDSKVGLELRFGDAAHGLSTHFAALQGHDTQSGLPTIGTDLMNYTQEAIGPVAFSYYRYDGNRLDRPLADSFWRQGFGLTYYSSRWESETVWQTGYDSTYLGAFAPTMSSGFFTQLRYTFGPRLFALARYEGTNDPTNGFQRDLVPLLGYRVSRNSRLTIEDVLRHQPATSNTFNMQYTVAY